MTSDTMRFLLKKLPKKTLIEIIIKNYETLFKDDEEGSKEAYREMALYIQAWSIMEGKTSIDKFYEPFKSELIEFMDNHSLRPSAIGEENE